MKLMNGFIFIISIIIIASNIFFVYYPNSDLKNEPNKESTIAAKSRVSETVVLNEFLANPLSDWDGDWVNSSTGDEWIELYNHGLLPVNISNWYINDSVSIKYIFPLGIEIPPKGFYVAYGSNQSLGLNNAGDSIKLFNSTGSLIDSYTYDSSQADTSWGRVPDGAANWTEFNEPTPKSTNGLLPKIVINELMFDPIGSDTGNEWLELFNNDTNSIDLTGWVLTDQDGDVDHIFDNILFPPQKFIIIYTGYGTDDLDFSDDCAHLFMSKDSAMMDNNGDDVLLTERHGLVIDYVAYGKSTNIDPPLSGVYDWDGLWYDHDISNYTLGHSNPTAEYGSSIHRILNGQDTNSVFDWGNASGIEITPGWNNNDVYGFEATCDRYIEYINTSEITVFNIKISNLGKNPLTLVLNLSSSLIGWSAVLGSSIINISSKITINVSLTVTAPADLTTGNEFMCNVTIHALNITINLTETLTFTIIIPAVDLRISDLSLDGSTDVNLLHQGELVYLKAKVTNNGELTGGLFSVGFYYDQVNEDHLLGEVNYDYIYTTSNKYPGIYWDTLGFIGNVTLIIYVDNSNDIIESNEDNNRMEYNITLLDTSPNNTEEQLLITEIFYDPTISYEPDEFVKIFNPTEISIDLSGWQLTDDPAKGIQDTITIPDNTWLEPGQELYITNDAEKFLDELGFAPDLACISAGLENVKVLEHPSSWPGFANNGDLVVLRNDFRHIIDLVCYGIEDPSRYIDHWYGPACPALPEGKILKRQRDSNGLLFMDSNTAIDWESPRLYAPGQSDFYPQTFEFTGEVLPFVNPENGFNTIMTELRRVNQTIYLNAYEFTHPEIVEPLLAALTRNVTVRLLLEGNPVGWNFTNVYDPENIKYEEYTQKYLLSQLYNSGAEIKFLSNIKNDKKVKDLNKRYEYNHAKYIILDSKTTLIMSGNFKPESVSGNITFGNREWGVIIRDPNVAGYFNDVFLSDWEAYSEYQNDTHCYNPLSEVYGPPPEFFKVQSINSSNYYEPSINDNIKDPVQTFNGNFMVTPILAPDTAIRDTGSVLEMINSASESVLIQQMDCNLDWRYVYTSTNELVINWSDPENYYLNWLDDGSYYNKYLTAAIDAARRGCNVKILLDSRYVELDVGPGRLFQDSEVDNLDVVQYINELAKLEGLTNNLEARLCYLSGLEKVHNKGVIVDGVEVLVSSINWNHNSVTNNREVGVIIKNVQVAEFFGEFFDYDWTRSMSVNKPLPTNSSERAILITEVYADTYLSRDADEYIALYNPSMEFVDISGWVITDKLTGYSGSEGVLLFPVGSMIKPKETLYIARNADSFREEHGYLPDYEYINDTLNKVPQLEIIDPSTAAGTSRGIQLANKGDEVVLTDEFLFYATGSENEHIIDMVVYGNSTYVTNFKNIAFPFNTTLHWQGKAVYNVSEGEILKRNREKDDVCLDDFRTNFIDTNFASDWENCHVYHPAQSDFTFTPVEYTGSATVFSSPDSSFEIISSELTKAKDTIYISIYQFHHLYLMDILMNASRRGVDVKVFIDGSPVGGLTDLARYVAKNLVEAGCEVNFIRSVAVENIHRRYSFVHTKYAIIDNHTVILLSENWKTSGVPVDNTAGNRGWGVVLRDQRLALDFARVFFSDWSPQIKDTYAFNSSDLKYGNPPDDFLPSWSVFGGDYKPRFESRTINGVFKVTPVIAPDTTLNTYGSILELINSATKSVYIEQLDCYINWNTKGREIENLYLEAAIDAARRGCEVKILLDSTFSYPDNPALDNYDTVQYINNIARSEGMTDTLQARLIYLSGSSGKNELALLHNKGVIVDGTKTLVSSINWATGSVIYNRESGVIIENPTVARFFAELFNYDWNLTVQELVEVIVLHSDTREIAAGQETVYTISILNIQQQGQNISLSLTGFEPHWHAELDITELYLPPSNQFSVTPVEVKLTVNAPNQEYILNITKNDKSKADQEVTATKCTLELGLVLMTNNMSAEVVYTRTIVQEVSEDEDDGDDKPVGALDTANVNPWLVIILLAVILIVGAVARDVITSRLDKKKKNNGMGGQEKFEDNKEEIEELEE